MVLSFLMNEMSYIFHQAFVQERSGVSPSLDQQVQAQLRMTLLKTFSAQPHKPLQVARGGHVKRLSAIQPGMDTLW